MYAKSRPISQGTRRHENYSSLKIGTKFILSSPSRPDSQLFYPFRKSLSMSWIEKPRNFLIKLSSKGRLLNESAANKNAFVFLLIPLEKRLRRAWKARRKSRSMPRQNAVPGIPHILHKNGRRSWAQGTAAAFSDLTDPFPAPAKRRVPAGRAKFALYNTAFYGIMPVNIVK